MTDESYPRPLSLLDLENIPPRWRRGDRPVVMDATPVECRGEALDPIWWRGRQWAVTEHGLESLDGLYAIAKQRLREGIEGHGWVQHMAEKGWVDRDDFATAWLVGLVLHGDQGELVRKAIAR